MLQNRRTAIACARGPIGSLGGGLGSRVCVRTQSWRVRALVASGAGSGAPDEAPDGAA